MDELASSSENAPHLIIDSSATDEQRAALRVLEQLVPYYRPVALDSALTLIIKTNAARVAYFDPVTEDSIDNDPNIQELKRSMERAKNQIDLRDAIIRQRFIVFAGRVAAQTAQQAEEQPA